MTREKAGHFLPVTFLVFALGASIGAKPTRWLLAITLALPS
jgi:hypothetical protein